ncbi:21756_t:CDS:1 [Dentiscutata erythropus]|uniref:21756_t:CDS:1 n=1 Tax=Dentiscutata erythropus TaxID=1348616 RepID=A0A9N9EYA3_9GLOM|nr:21756_t:CDS:1 [Dentiscutata erythropus]
MDEAAKRKHCGLLMFEVPTPSFTKSGNRSATPIQFTIDCTSSMENSNIRKDNFIYTSFVEPIKVNPQRPHKNTPITSAEQESTKSNEAVKISQHKEKRIRRPPNSFLLYRQSKQSEVTRVYGNISNAKISKILSDLWQRESDEVKLYWQKAADKKKMEHMLTYPEYVYRSKSATPKKKRKSKATDSNQIQNALPVAQTSNMDVSTLLSEPIIIPSHPWFYDQFEIPKPSALPSIFPNEGFNYNFINTHNTLNYEQQPLIEETASISYSTYDDNTYTF